LIGYPSVGGGRRCLEKEKRKRLHGEEVVSTRDENAEVLDDKSSGFMYVLEELESVCLRQDAPYLYPFIISYWLVFYHSPRWSGSGTEATSMPIVTFFVLANTSLASAVHYWWTTHSPLVAQCVVGD
jgi:hypothetical protein